MKKFKRLPFLAIALLVSSAVGAESHSETQEPPETTIMNPQMMTPQMMGPQMMNPQMMEQMMGYGQSRGMPMMNPQSMQQMMPHMNMMGPGYGYHHGMPMMGGAGNMMMYPQMMQMRMQHMFKIEQRLENIESLLSQILEQQKLK